MISFSSLSKRRGATLAGVFSLALSCVLLLCGAGSVPLENFLPQGAMQGDLNAGGHNLTNAATVFTTTVSATAVNATNVAVSGSLTVPSSFALPFSHLASTPTSLAGYGITDPVVLTNGSYANPLWITSLATSKLTGTLPITLSTSGTSGAATFTGNTLTIPQYQGVITLTTTGTSGAATFSGNTLNVPQYTGTIYTAGTGLTLTGSQFNVTANTYDAYGAASTAQAASLQKSSNLSDVGSAATARTNLGLGTAATASVSAFAPATSGSSILAGNGSGGTATATTAQAAALLSGGSGTLNLGNYTLSLNLSQMPSGVAQTALANSFTAPQTFTGIQMATGPEGLYMVHSGDSRLAAGYFDSSAWGNDTGYTNFNDSPIANALEGCSYSWVFSPTCLVSAIQQMGFGVNSLNFNYGQSGCGIQNALNAYALGCVTTTGNITAGSATITITGGTSGLSGTMIVEGPGIPPGIWCNTSTGALSDGVVGGSFTTARKPSVTTTGATLVFIPQSEATAFSANSYITTANEPVPHQLSPAVSGPAGSIFFIESAINDDYAWTSSATLSTSTKTVTGVTLPTNYLIPVGYGISGTGIPSGATVVSNTQTTITYTASSNSTVSGSETITVTPVLSAWETQAASLISLALADSWNVVIETPEKSWATPWSTGESFRQSMVAWEKATYGGAAFGGSTVTGVTVVDVAGMGIFGSNDKTIYQDGTHLTPRANALVANFLEQQLGPLFSSGPPQTMGGPGSIALDWLQRELGSLSLGPRPDGQSVLLYAYSGGNSSAICLGAPGNGPNFSWSESPKEFFFNSWIGFPMAVNGSTSVNATVPAIPNTQTTSVTGSTSGTAVFSEPFYQPGYKKVMIVCSSLVGTASYTFPTAFTTTPVALATSGPATSVVTSLSTTAVTVTGATTTGALILEGY